MGLISATRTFTDCGKRSNDNLITVVSLVITSDVIVIYIIHVTLSLSFNKIDSTKFQGVVTLLSENVKRLYKSVINRHVDNPS